MLAVIAAVLFFIAYIFHGAGFHPAVWIDWQSLVIAGFVLLSLHLTPVYGWVRRR